MKTYEATEIAYKNGYEKGKQDAVIEFAERLKEYKYLSSDWSHGEHPFVVEENDIDQLLEEMLRACKEIWDNSKT